MKIARKLRGHHNLQKYAISLKRQLVDLSANRSNKGLRHLAYRRQKPICTWLRTYNPLERTKC